MRLELAPIDQAEAFTFIRRHHRHHAPPLSWKWGTAAVMSGRIVGVITVGRPVARMLDDGWTVEVTRLCTDGTRNACSFLYRAAWNAARFRGYRRLITYTLESETGTSLFAAGFWPLWLTSGGSWSRPSRARRDRHPLERKILWEVA